MSTIMPPTAAVPGLPGAAEKPRNGLAGLKHWRQDLAAGLLVSLISLPFSLGIAVASGAPPISGIISAIIAGFVLPFLGGSYVTISGPAAGLAPALLAGMTVLGRGDLERGYPLLLVAICLTGVVQLVLARLRAARFSALFPAAVVEGMLAAIGLLIIAKQLPMLVGQPFEAHEFWHILAETPEQLGRMDPRVFGLGMASLLLIFVLAGLKSRWLRLVPPQVIVVALGTLVGIGLHLEPRYLIAIPANPLSHGLVLPDFGEMIADRALWSSLAVIVVTLTLIDGVESLATIAAIDKIDPFRRKSDPDRTLQAMGVSNICSSLAGGLTIIPGGVKSTANIMGGGRTQWANFYNACFLLIFLLFGRGLINAIPFSVLGAVLIYTGYKLCRPGVWRHIAAIGREQLALFTITVLVTLSTDLLVGIFAGIAAKLLLNAWYSLASLRTGSGARPVGWGRSASSQLASMFRNPVIGREARDGEYRIAFGGPLVCFNLLQIGRELAKIPSETRTVRLHLTDAVTLVDHTACENLLDFAEEYERSGRGHVSILGLEDLQRQSEFASCMRIRARKALEDPVDRLLDRPSTAVELLPQQTRPDLAVPPSERRREAERVLSEFDLPRDERCTLRPIDDLARWSLVQDARPDASKGRSGWPDGGRI
ncbi:SulP family inorganic anion transporter [Tautonia plasticadhaerens]|uniref:Bicarbonate transporter BicA n=1 Tax=Tautonia plasticadhaerens TaxID=2527974 RepID=A0A518GW47_9BACT|nr:SulP family inorganic anion transporter [Tautonia plasticadhaerens]QDV32816.1 Bicarbonate transporter BicA [Tautonia plasticadhaerens]